MVRHCLDRIIKAKNADKTGITQVPASEGIFKCRSFTEGVKDVYKLDFGDAVRMPSCTCEDWRKSAYPCKHFFAVFMKYPEWGWNRLSPSYRTSPFLTLDEEITQSTETVETDVIFEDIIPDIMEHSLPDESSSSVPPPLPVPIPSLPRQSTLRSCKESLKQLQELSFLLKDETTLADMVHDLKEVAAKYQQFVETEDGLPLRPEGEQVWKEKFKCNPLPQKKKKQKVSKRVGVVEERRQRQIKEAAEQLSIANSIIKQAHEVTVETVEVDHAEIADVETFQVSHGTSILQISAGLTF